jgi:hypothetical protein
MKRILFATLIVGCTHNADIGISSTPITCQPAAAGAANGTVTNAQTHAGYTFGTVSARLVPTTPTAAATGVTLDDSSLSLTVSFPCGQQLGMYEVGQPQTACPMFVASSVSSANQQVFANGRTGIVILDQNVGCLAGRYDIDFGYKMDTGAIVDQGTVAGWFSVPLQ